MTDTLDFTDPVEMLLALDDDLITRRVNLHKWQIGFMLDFARREYTAEESFKAVVRAANGSGKDKYVIAPCMLWLCMKYPNAVCVCTSSSGTQLDRQTNTYIKQLAEACNVKFGGEVWKINYRHYECMVTGSTIEMFVTDEAGRAEGWHPVVPSGKLGIFVSEAKTIHDDIFTALARCTGFTHRVDVSSPGLPMGHFFNVDSMAKPRRELATSELDAHLSRWIRYHITAYDCSHLPLSYIEELKRTMPGGADGAAFKSCVDAEFGTTDEMVVIPYHYVWRSVNDVRVGHLGETHNIGGLDLAAGGDETVLAVRNGNKLLTVIPFRFDNSQDTISFLERKFREYNLTEPDAYIYADSGGLGKPIIDQLRNRGWTNIRYVLNQAKAKDERTYVNRGAEMWFNFGKLLEGREVWLCNDDKLGRQLASRYYKITDGNRHQLESKLQARAKGHPSPDRADAVVLCFSHYKSKLADVRVERAAPVVRAPERPPVKPFSLRVWATGSTGTVEDYLAKQFRGRNTDIYQVLCERHNAEVRRKQEQQQQQN